MDSEFIWKGKGLRITNTMLKNKVGLLTLLDFNNYQTIVYQCRIELVKKQTHRLIESSK